MQQIELMKQLKVIISGGGTGGHIFPALAIAKAIEKKVADVEFLFVGAEDRMEMEKIPAAGYKIVGLWISGLQRNLSSRNLLFPFKVMSSLVKARKILKKFKPDLAIGTGGYASGPLLFAAANNGVPSLIQEQNSYPGITNKILSKYVQKVCVAYDNMERFFGNEKLIITGNPIREDILDFEAKIEEGRNKFNIDSSKPTVLVVGGSLGARTINNAIAENIEFFKTADVNLIWQTGISFQDKSQEIIKGVNASGIQAHTFIKEMDLAYAAADVIVSRAGAIAISELCCVAKPIILVPSPNVSENHQYKNAQSLVNKNAALLVEDKEASRKLVSTLMELVEDKTLQLSLSSNIKKLAVKNAADEDSRNCIEFNKMNLDLYKHIYLIGIGGIGMSALARYFNAKGKHVCGYDKVQSALCKELENEGINIHYTDGIEYIPKAIKEATYNEILVIYTPAIPAENPELTYFTDKGFKLHKRAEVLGLISRQSFTIAVAGTHGKTTTSAILAHILYSAGKQSTAFLGGISKNYNTNLLLAEKGNILIVEADEYDRSFLQLATRYSYYYFSRC